MWNSKTVQKEELPTAVREWRFCWGQQEAAGWSGVWLTPHLVQHRDKGLHHACCACTAPWGFSTTEQNASSSLMDRVNARQVTEVQQKKNNLSAWFNVLEAFYSSFRVALKATQVPAVQDGKVLQASAQELPQLWSQPSSQWHCLSCRGDRVGWP